MRRWALSLLILAGGLALNVVALTLADRHAQSFPTVPDVVVDRLPFVDLYAYGEAYLGLYIGLFIVLYLRQPSRNLPYLLSSVGLLYAGRALFLLTLPIGAPAAALHADDRLSLYPFGDHSYFPSGHFGLMCLLAMNLTSHTVRRLFWVAAVVFGFGTLLTKAHYTADLLGGFLLAYAVHAWGERRLKHYWLPAGKPVQVPETQFASSTAKRPADPATPKQA